MILNQGSYNFAAHPQVVAAKQKFRDPYSGKEIDYAPSNIMYDRRVMRGSTYASIIIPATNLPNKPKPRETVKEMQAQPQQQIIERQIATPEPYPGRLNVQVQTEELREELTDKAPEGTFGAQTDFYIDRPATPLFSQQNRGEDQATQVNDEDLFDFDEEVRPMLEALCNKLLERARMETLEEEELRIIREQQREFEQTRNAELIEAQQMEACENRKQEEIQRRKLQQRASKDLALSTHKKLFARVFAKNYLGKMVSDSFNALISQGVLREPGERAMLGHIVPWIYENTAEAFEEDKDMDILINELTQAAHEQIAGDHDEALGRERKRREQKIYEDRCRAEELRALQEKLRAEQEEQKRKEDLQKLHEEITQQAVERGEWRNEILAQPMANIHGNFQSRPIVGVLGGLIGQLAISLTAAVQALGNDEFINEKTAYKFFAILVSDILKADSYELFLNAELEKMILDKGGRLDELNLLDEETAEVFIEEYKNNAGGDELLRKFVERFETYGISMELTKLIINSLMRLIFLKFTDKAIQGKQGNARKKLKLVTLPESFKRDPNKPQAVVRIRIPLNREEDESKDEEEDKGEESKEGEEPEKPEEKEPKVYPEIEYEDKVLAVNPITENLHVYVSHQAAARELRNQICEFVKEHFEEEFEAVKIEDMHQKAEELAVTAENDFMKLFSDIPTFDYEKN